MKTKFLFLCLLLPIGMIGQNNKSTHLVIYDNDGIKVSYCLQDFPKIFVDQNCLKIQTPLVGVDYDISDIGRYMFEYMEKIPTGAKEIANDENKCQIVNNAVYMNLSGNSMINLYTINGMLVFSKYIQQSGEYFYSLDNLSFGVYLLKINQTTCKIVKK